MLKQKIMPAEKFDDLPKIVSKMDYLCLQELYGSKHGVWATALQAKFFEYACCKDSVALSMLFSDMFLGLVEFADCLGKSLICMGEVPMYANSNNVYWNGSCIDRVLVEQEIKSLFVKKMEELMIESMLVEKQIGILSLKKACKEFCLWCKSQKELLTNHKSPDCITDA